MTISPLVIPVTFGTINQPPGIQANQFDQVNTAISVTVNLLVAQANVTGLTSIPWAIAAGTSDAITANFTAFGSVATLTDGLTLSFRATAANGTTTPTFAPTITTPFTAQTLTRGGGVALNIGDIPGNLAECIVRYNLANTRWELLNPARPREFFGALAALPAGGATTTIAHPFGVVPSRWAIPLQCITANLGYTGGQKLDSQCFLDSNNKPAFATWADQTSLYITLSTAATPNAMSQSTFAYVNITTANWNIAPWAML